jgi:hypothetical protein
MNWHALFTIRLFALNPSTSSRKMSASFGSSPLAPSQSVSQKRASSGTLPATHPRHARHTWGIWPVLGRHVGYVRGGMTSQRSERALSPDAFTMIHVLELAQAANKWMAWQWGVGESNALPKNPMSTRAGLIGGTSRSWTERGLHGWGVRQKLSGHPRGGTGEVWGTEDQAGEERTQWDLLRETPGYGREHERWEHVLSAVRVWVGGHQHVRHRRREFAASHGKGWMVRLQ